MKDLISTVETYQSNATIFLAAGGSFSIFYDNFDKDQTSADIEKDFYDYLSGIGYLDAEKLTDADSEKLLSVLIHLRN